MDRDAPTPPPPVVLITGASRGIGRALALGFAAEGARLFLCARDAAALGQVAAACLEAGAARAEWSAVDLARTDWVREIAKSCEAALGVPDVLVNNAGVLGPVAPLRRVTERELRDVLEVNLVAVHTLGRYVGNAMARRGSGVVINVTSGYGRRGRARFGPYVVSKFALEGLTQVMAEEWRDHGVRVYAINPGPTRTEMRRAAAPGEPADRLPEPGHMVAPVLFLASPAAAGWTGVSVNARVFDPAAPTRFLEQASLRIDLPAMPVSLTHPDVT